MRDLKLRYVVQLLSNLETQSGRDAKAMVEAQKRVQDALEKTSGKVGRLEQFLLRVAGAGTASAERQAMVLARLAVRYDQVASAAERYAKAAAKATPQVMAGGAAGAYAVGAMTQRPMEYSTRLAQMSNTAFAQRDVAGRIEGKQTLDAAIRAAVRVGGGSRDAAAEALDALIASGTMTPQQAIALLPRLMKGSTASGATPTELGMIGVRSAQSFRIPMEQMDQVLNEAMAAGQAGGFELRDMAKWLPQTMAAGSTAGMGGMDDLRRLLASMQAGVTTAGSKDEAGNNLVNLLAKINSRDTANDFSKQGIDLTGRLATARGQGVNALDAFVDLVDEVASRDKAFVEAKRKLASAGTAGEKAEAANSVLQLLQGKAVGQVIQDRQALMALVAELGQRDYVKSVMQRSRTDTGAIGTAFGVMSQETGFAKQQAANELAFAQDSAFKAVEPVFKGIFESGSEVARMFPTLAAATVGLTGAFAAAAAALGGGAVGGMLAGRGAAAAAGAGAAGAGAAGAGAGAAVAGGARFARFGVAGAAAFAGWQSLRLWDAVGQLRDARAQEAEAKRGSFLTPETRARLERQRMPLPPGPGLPGQPDLLGVPGMGGGLALGQGKLDVAVRVTDDRVTATTQVTQPMSLVKINPGNTNPGSYR
jgi:hypothetical protein